MLRQRPLSPDLPFLVGARPPPTFSGWMQTRADRVFAVWRVPRVACRQSAYGLQLALRHAGSSAWLGRQWGAWSGRSCGGATLLHPMPICPFSCTCVCLSGLSLSGHICVKWAPLSSPPDWPCSNYSERRNSKVTLRKVQQMTITDGR